MTQQVITFNAGKTTCEETPGKWCRFLGTTGFGTTICMLFGNETLCVDDGETVRLSHCLSVADTNDEQKTITEENMTQVNSNQAIDFMSAVRDEYAMGLDPISEAMAEMQDTQDKMEEMQLTPAFREELRRVADDTNTHAFMAQFLNDDACKMVIIAYQRSIAANSVL